MMKLGWIRIGAAASAACALVAMGSSASAQYGNPEYCEYVAMVVCSHDERGFPQDPTWECFQAEYAACMNGYASFEPRLPSYDRSRGVEAAV